VIPGRSFSRRGDAPKPCSRRPTAGARVPKARRGEAEGVAARILELAS